MSTPEKIEELTQNLIMKVFPIIYFSPPYLVYELSDQDLERFEQNRKKAKTKSKPHKKESKPPQELTFVHFAILSWLRLIKEKGNKITHIDLYKKVEKTITTKDPYDKYQRKTMDLRLVEFIKEEKQFGDFFLEITQKGLEALNQGEKRRKEFFIKIIKQMPDQIQNILPLIEKLSEGVNKEILPE